MLLLMGVVTGHAGEARPPGGLGGERSCLQSRRREPAPGPEGLPRGAASRQHSPGHAGFSSAALAFLPLQRAGFSAHWLLLSWSAGSRTQASVVAGSQAPEHGLSSCGALA